MSDLSALNCSSHAVVCVCEKQEQPKTSDKDKEPLEDQIRKRLQLTEIKLKFGPKTEGTALGSNHGIEALPLLLHSEPCRFTSPIA
eukprot:3634912-Amphidinium_carterae.2